MEDSVVLLRRRIRLLEHEDDDPCYLPHQKLDGMPRGTDVSSPTEATAIRLVERAGRRGEHIARLKTEAYLLEGGCLAWREAMGRIPAQEAAVIRGLYREMRRAGAIGEALGVSRATVYNMERRGLMRIWRIKKGGAA